MDADRIDRFRLARTAGVGPVTYRRLLARYPDPAEAIAALAGIARAGGRARPPAIPTAAAMAREVEGVARLGGQMLLLGDADYPPLLGLLHDAPPLLSVLGDPEILRQPAVGLVGSRNASANGRRMAEALAADLVQAGLLVVSGLARGIDAAAHLGALLLGRTVAAVAGGLDRPYPEDHAALQARIARSGAVVTEAPLGTAPQSRHFPRRNRLIAGLSLGVVVVEAAPHSGSLITARLAQDAGRELFAVPGSPLDPRSRGGNHLIREGAHLVEQAADVLAHLPAYPAVAARAPAPPLAAAPVLPATSAAEASAASPFDGGDPRDLEQARRDVLGLLGPAPTAVDDLVRRCHFSASAVMAVLLELELAGRVETLPGNRVCLLS